MSRFAFRPLLAFCALVAVLAFAVSEADARAGRGGRLIRRRHRRQRHLVRDRLNAA